MADLEKVQKLIASASIISMKEFQNIIFEKTPYVSSVNTSKQCVFILSGIEKLAYYESVVSDMYYENNDISATVSRKSFNNYIDSLLFQWKSENHEVTKSDIDSFFLYFTNQPIIDYNFVKGVYGLRLNSNNKECKIGPFTFYHQPYYVQVLSSTNKMDQELLWYGWHNEYLVTVNIKARDIDKAKEISYELFYQLELFIFYSIGQFNKKFAVNIVTQISYPFDNCLVLNDKETTSSYSREIIDLIPIDDPYYFDKSIGNDKLWELLRTPSIDKMKKRIISGIEWIGKANSEINIKNRFLFYLISLESVFTFQEKTLISPSIVSTLCEGVAFILGNDKEERLEIDRIIKKLYEIRSALSHGSDKSISEQELQLACFYSTNIIRAFLVVDELFAIKSPEDLNKYIKSKKYS
jgi:hypothetical protein